MARHRTHGIALKMGDGAGTEVFTTIGQVRRITPPSGRRGFTPVATHDMTTAMKKIGDALRDEGQISFEIDFDPALATHDFTTGLAKKFRDGGSGEGGTINWQLVFPDTGALLGAFAALVTDFRFLDYPANSGVGGVAVTLEISDAITWTP